MIWTQLYGIKNSSLIRIIYKKIYLTIDETFKGTTGPDENEPLSNGK